MHETAKRSTLVEVHRARFENVLVRASCLNIQEGTQNQVHLDDEKSTQHNLLLEFPTSTFCVQISEASRLQNLQMHF